MRAVTPPPYFRGSLPNAFIILWFISFTDIWQVIVTETHGKAGIIPPLKVLVVWRNNDSHTRQRMVASEKLQDGKCGSLKQPKAAMSNPL